MKKFSKKYGKKLFPDYEKGNPGSWSRSDSSRVIFWDFDGTLAYRPGEWRGCLVEVLDEIEPGHGITSDAIRPHLQEGFPWHRPDRPHPELADADDWWALVQSILARGLRAEGISPTRSEEIVREFRVRYIDGTVGWKLCPDVIPVLARLREKSWRHVIVSNHVPELFAIVDSVGLGELVENVISSATVGYEKPHPEIFSIARMLSKDPVEMWMIGDNAQADVAGARAAGIPAILVQHPDRPLTPDAVGLLGVEKIICG